MRPDIPCIILAGGRSQRFGSNKALALFQGRPLIDFLIRRLEAQTTGPIVINGSSEIEAAKPELSLIPDRLTGSIGPLAGLHAALCWAAENGHKQIITTPVDTPILPDSFVERLVANGASSIASSKSGLHPVHGIWPSELKDQLAERLAHGMRAVRDWSAACMASECRFEDAGDHDPFFNVNTPEDLERLKALQEVSPR